MAQVPAAASGLRFPRFDVAPAPVDDRPQRYYVGRRGARGGDVWVVSAAVEPLVGLERWSRAPFTWGGRPGPGALELAAALLADHVQVRVARATAHQLALDLLEGLPAEAFVLTGDDLRFWLDAADCGRSGRLGRRPRS